MKPTASSGVVAGDIRFSKYREAIEILVARGYMQNAKLIYPNRAITRAEFLKILSLAQGYTSPVQVTKTFADLPAGHSLAPYVYYGVSK